MVVDLFTMREFLISPWNKYLTILIIWSILQFCIFIQTLSFSFFSSSSLKYTVTYVAGALLYFNNMYICLKEVCVPYTFHLLKTVWRGCDYLLSLERGLPSFLIFHLRTCV
jgi:hypothetical protein